MAEAQAKTDAPLAVRELNYTETPARTEIVAVLERAIALWTDRAAEHVRRGHHGRAHKARNRAQVIAAQLEIAQLDGSERDEQGSEPY